MNNEQGIGERMDNESFADISAEVVKLEFSRLNAKIESLESDLAEAVRMLFHPAGVENSELRAFNHRPNVRAIIERDGK